MKIQTRFDIGQAIFVHNVVEEKVERHHVIAIKINAWYDAIEGYIISMLYQLENNRWVNDTHTFVTEEDANKECEEWAKL